jgi:membrane fusion protein, multidrug efflux system
MKMPPRRAALAVFPVAALALTAACGTHAPDEVESETVVAVKVAPAMLGDIRGVVHATGVVTPAAGADLVVVAPEAARIAEIPPASGDRVQRGDVLVRFEIPNSAAEVQRQAAEVVRAQALLDNAKKAQTRARDLFERGVAAGREVEDATRAVAEAEAALTQAGASLAAAQTVAARSTVRATFDGIVARRAHNPGDLVEPTASDPVLRVIDPRRLEVVASVALSDASRIVMGAEGELAAPGGAAGPRLTVVSRPVAVDSGTATIPVRLRFADTPNLPAGAPVEVEIDAERHSGVVLVPAVAIVREGDETAVFVASDGKARRRPVKTGLSDETSVEILSGVAAGEMVIVDGQAGLPDDAAIAIGSGKDAEK